VYELGTSQFQDCPTFENAILPDNLPSLLYAAKVVRTPYQTPAGPDALLVTATPPVVSAGESFELTATLDDTRYNNSHGAEPTQNVDAGEYYVGLPPWAPGSPAPAGMFAVDGSFDSPTEAVTAPVSTSGLDPGRHLVFVRGRDADGNWGAFGATFITVSDDQADDDGDGVPNGADCDPDDETVWAPPSPARELTITREAADNVSWLPPLEPGASVLGYQLLRSTAADDFDEADCTNVGSVTLATDVELPASGTAYHYLVRSVNRCGGNLGHTSSGQPRTGTDCGL
jgi:hypothetical protein